jgi:hypothetical protein
MTSARRRMIVENSCSRSLEQTADNRPRLFRLTAWKEGGGKCGRYFERPLEAALTFRA